MATATITGPVYGVSSTYDFIEMSVVFELSHWDRQEDVGLFASGPLIVPVDDNGDFKTELMVNGDGENFTHYQCFLQYRRNDRTEWIREPVGVFSLQSEGVYKLSDLDIVSVEGVESSLDVYTVIRGILDEIIENTKQFDIEFARIESAVNDDPGTWTTKDGVVSDNLRKRLNDIGFYPPVAFESGLEITESVFTVIYEDVVYYANPESVPFTTTGTFDVNEWRMSTGLNTPTAIPEIIDLTGDGTVGPYPIARDPISSRLVHLFVGGAYKVPEVDYTIVDDASSLSGKGIQFTNPVIKGSHIIGSLWEPVNVKAVGPEMVLFPGGETLEQKMSLQGPSFDTRAEAVTFSQSAFGMIFSDGVVITANNRSYQRKAGATDIADMPGWVPFGHIIFPDQFGDGFDGIVEDTATVRMCHFYANEHGYWVSYSGCDYASIQANAWIIVNTNFNLSSCELKAVGGLNGTPASHTVNTMYHIYDADTPLVTGNVDTPAADGSLVADLQAGSTRPTADFFRHMGYVYIQGSGGTGPNISNRDKDGLLSYRQSFATQVNGRTCQPLSLDMTTETELWYGYRAMPARGRINIGGGVLDTTTFNNQEIFRIERNNVGVSDIQLQQKDGDADPDTINRLIKIYNAAYVYLDDVTAHAQQDGGDGGGTYVFNFENFAEVYMNNCTAIEGWGAMGTNNGNGLYISNCNLNRVDFHNGGHNYFVSDSTIYNRGVYVGWGGGTLQITNCKWIDAPVVQFRTDYGGYFHGEIIVDGIVANNQGFVWTIVDALSNPVGTEVISAPVARSIVVRNCHRTDLDENGNNREIVPVAIGVNTDAAIMNPIAPSNISVSNITCAGNWRMSMPIDYQNMLLPADTDFCALNLSNVKPTRRQFDGLGVNIPAQKASQPAEAGDFKVEVFASDCTKLSVNFENQDKIQTHIYSSDICRVAVPVGTVCEIVGGLLTDPDWHTGETHVPIGGSRTGTGYTTLRDVKVTGEVDDDDGTIGWDLSNVEVMIGVDIPDIAANDTVMLPDGCLTKHAFYGWRKGDPSGEVTPDYFGSNTTPGTTDFTDVLETAMEYMAARKQVLHFKQEYAYTNLNPDVDGGAVYWKFHGDAKLTQLSDRVASTEALRVAATKLVDAEPVTATVTANSNTISVADITDFEEGRLVRVQSNKLIKGDHRFSEYFCFQQVMKVQSATGTTVTFDDPFVWDMEVGLKASGTAQSGTATTIVLDVAETATRDDIEGRPIVLTDGTGSGQTRWIEHYDEATKTATLDGLYTGADLVVFGQAEWDTVPDATTTYTVTAEVTADCWDNLEAVEIDGMVLDGYAEDSVNVYGVIIGYANGVKLTNSYIDHCSNMSLYTYLCYKPVVHNNTFVRANYAYGGGSGRGYGYEDYTSFKPVVHDNLAMYCRTGFDMVQCSYGMERYDNEAIGGGKTYAGVDFWPIGSEPNSGFSSHTGGMNVTDRNNTYHNVMTNKVRGDHTILGATFSGQINYCFNVFYGGKAIFKGATFNNDYAYIPRVSVSNFDNGVDGPRSPAAEPQLPEAFVTIQQSKMMEKASVIVRGNTIDGTLGDFVTITDETTDSDLHLEVVGNTVTTVQRSGDGDSSIIDATGALSLGKLICHSNTLNWGGSQAGGVAYDNFNPYPIIELLEPSDMLIDLGHGSYAGVMADDGTRVTLPVGNSTGLHKLTVRKATHNTDGGATDIAANYVWWEGLVSPTIGEVSEWQNQGCEFNTSYNVVLSDSTVTDGQFGMVMRSNDNLQFYNRTGDDAVFYFDVSTTL